MRSKKMTKQELKTFGANVDTYRQRAGLTWTALGVAAGISRQQINHVKDADNGISLPVYKRLCEVLRTSKPPLL